MRRTITIASIAGLAAAGVLRAQSNIDNTVPNKFAWGENVGWTNWRDANGAADGVNVGPFVMAGFIWAENLGWISVGDGSPATPPFYANADASDFGVNIDPDGDLHGYAWGENVGWINLDGGAMASPAQPARINCDGRLNGYAWAENLGWINLSVVDPGKFVAVDSTLIPLACDVNHDGTKNGLDVQAFFDLLVGGGADWTDICSADQPPLDGTIDTGDVAAFVTCLLSPW